MKRELIITEDGSHSIYMKDMQEHYHSIHGAISESKHVFIESGYNKVVKEFKSLNILEIGFGTGLNAYLTYIESKKYSKRINYVAIEPYPLGYELYEKLNYPVQLGELDSEIFLNMHHTNWIVPFFISDNFILSKIESKIEDIHLQENQFQLVYFDAFAPDKQSEVWARQVFENIYQAMCQDAVLVTYSAKGELKRLLKDIGFTVEILQGFAQKKEMIRAIKK